MAFLPRNRLPSPSLKLLLVRRSPDQEDRRRVHLTLTPAAEKRLEQLTRAHRDELKRLAALWDTLFQALADGA